MDLLKVVKLSILNTLHYQDDENNIALMNAIYCVNGLCHGNVPTLQSFSIESLVLDLETCTATCLQQRRESFPLTLDKALSF